MKATWTQKDPFAPNKTADRNRWWVILDLLNRGYEVYHKIGLSGKNDFIIVPGKLRIKVKSARRYKGGKIYVHPTIGKHYDILAMVLPDQIIYEPELLEKENTKW